MTDVCEQCGNKYESIGTHWSMNPSCSHPSFTQHQREIITGLLMGDGCIDTCNKHPRLDVRMISENYLEYVASEFGVLGGEVRLSKTAEESAQQVRDGGLRPNADADNYSDVYAWQSMAHPELQSFADWYSSGEKVWPEDIELTPTVLKHWYCGDGYWNNNRSQNRISIAMSNEINNRNKVDELFENVGLPKPSNYSISERKNGGFKCDAVFTVTQSRELWEYMGKPLPDFKYKWPNQYH